MADAVKRAAPETSGLDPGELLHAVQHLLRGFVSECEQKNFAGAHTLREQVGDAVRERARFAGAGASEDEQRTRLGGDGGELLVIQLRTKIDRRNAVRRG